MSEPSLQTRWLQSSRHWGGKSGETQRHWSPRGKLEPRGTGLRKCLEVHLAISFYPQFKVSLEKLDWLLRLPWRANHTNKSHNAKPYNKAKQNIKQMTLHFRKEKKNEAKWKWNVSKKWSFLGIKIKWKKYEAQQGTEKGMTDITDWMKIFDVRDFLTLVLS